MIGRTRELETILAHIDRTPASSNARRPNVVFITGEAGIGKSTMLRAVTRALEKRKGRPDAPLVASTECSTPLLGQDVGQMEALEPWAELLEALVKQDDSGRGKEVLKLVGNLALAWGHLIPVVGAAFDTAALLKNHVEGGDKKSYAASQEQMFQQYINLLGKIADAHPLVLILDDFHWADTSSTNLLFSAARHLESKRVTFLVAYRADDAASSRGGKGHPLLHVRNELGRYSLFVDVVVPKMTTRDLDAMLRERYSRYEENDDFRRWLAERSGGNALFITQYLNTLEEDGIVSPQTGEFLARFDAVRVPNSASSVVEERIRRLDDDDRELLRYASVEGVTFTSAVLARMSETPRLKLLQRLRLIADKHGVIKSLGKQHLYGANDLTAYQFTNVVLQGALYDSLEEEEKEELHARVFTALKDEWDRAPDHSNVAGFAARLSIHAQSNAERSHAAMLLLEAARASWHRFAEEETLSVLSALRPHAIATAARALDAESLLLRGLVHKYRGRHDAALDDFRAATTIFESLGKTDRALESMMREAFTLENAHRWDDAEKRSRDVLALAEKHGDDRVKSAMQNNLGLVALGAGRNDEALDFQRKSLAIRERTRDVIGQAVALGSIGLALFSAGRFDEALEQHMKSLELRERIDDRIGQGYSLTNIGNVLAALGRLDDALTFHRRSIEVREAIGGVVTLATSLENEADVLTRLGRAEEAIERLERGMTLADRYGLKETAAKFRAELEKRGKHVNGIDGYVPPVEAPAQSQAHAQAHVQTHEEENACARPHPQAPPIAAAMEWLMDRFDRAIERMGGPRAGQS
jgi:tetratricopeptide (TPR) repeat protein